MDSNHQYLFLDFEFSMPESKANPPGFFPEIIEVGLVAIKNQQKETYSTYVKPRFFPVLSHRCKSFLSITQDEVENGIPFAELVGILSHYDSQAPTTVITWGNMDMKVLRNNCHKASIPFPFTGKTRDLAMEYKKFFGDQNQTGLWKAVQEYGKEGTGKHHCALDDALTTYNIFKLVEQDKRYLSAPPMTTIGERIDWQKLKNKLVF
ncbi:3'-5' exonuclease KapD [Bacillus sp. HMF5848]|uniref:3'-5' exonuclease KapD n=1 Tax=Bacillus sp. HMF5848 TaxID=2495421 RepID=UPI000F7A783E|nr:3'-5' exonuclease KapD [Bacillus sp. HMF5848]RSK28407.1 3'-5' exonuclease KapD [Bacillus sp. HMF5848]